MNKKLELLAPAGNFESLIAAIQNGADAVYIAGMRFGARANASNFDNEELIQAVNYAHERNVKIYVTVNIIINDDEIEDCIKYIDFLYNCDVDAVIVQDIGIADLISRYFPDFEMHASTQMSISNSIDGLFYKNMGFRRLVVARENSIQEIESIKSSSDLEIEAFVHGALCLSYSGKCLFSFMQGGRSGNRGNCAQPCRMKYSLTSDKGIKLHENKFVLSMKDLSTITNIKQIAGGCIDSLKIEGRMKRPEYVATVVRNYRKALDGIFNDTVSDEELIELENEIKYVFNREYTSGHILSTFPGKMVNLDSPKNKGVYLGKILDVDSKNKRLKIKLDDDLSKGDGLSTGEFVGRIIHKKEIKDHAPKGEIIDIDFIGNAKIGDSIFKTYNSGVMSAAKESYKKEFVKTPLQFSIKIKNASHPEICIQDDRNNKICYTDTEYLIEEALNRPTDEETIIRQISKLESTPYFSETVNIDKDPTSVIPVSVLNKLRRESISLISELRRNTNKRPYSDLNSIIREISEPKKYFSARNDSYEDSFVDSTISISAMCHTEEQIKACIDCGTDRIYLSDISLYKQYAHTDCQSGFHFVTPGMMKDRDIKELECFIKEYWPNIITSSLGYAEHTLRYYAENKISSSVGIDYMANLNNKFSVNFALGIYGGTIDTVAPGMEYVINQQYLDYTFNEASKSTVEIPVLSHPILMITEYCPYKTDGAKCKFPVCMINDSFLNGENNENYIIKADNFCKLNIYSTRVSELHVQSVRTLIEKNYRRFRLDFLNETYDQAVKYIKKYK